MTLNFTPVEKREKLSRDEFVERYFLPRKPVVIKDLSADWPATQKWTFDFFEKEYGDMDIPIFDPDAFHKAGKNYMKASYSMPFREYLSLIQREPTKLRFHNFQIMQAAPELTKDYSRPGIMNNFVMKFPLMFFGGKGATLGLHYDIDMSHVFLTHFQTQKEVFLFPWDQKEFLYHRPFTVQAKADILKPDFEKYPALKKAKGFRALINHGETLFIPRKVWHYVHYKEPGFSLALRSNESLAYQLRGGLNIARHFVVDHGLNKLLGSYWSNWKDDKAIENAEMAMRRAH